MTLEHTSLKDCYILTPNIFGDKRGSFFESFNKKDFYSATGLEVDFVQDNQSTSQKGEFAQAKLVRVIKGSVLDVVVDIRPKSSTFGKQFSMILSEQNHKQVFIPRGFAHGFLVLEDDTIFAYKCDNYYNKTSESGIIYNDKTLNIDWQFPIEDLIISEKDLKLPIFESLLR